MSRRTVRAGLGYALMFLLVFAFQEALFRLVFPLPRVLNFKRAYYARPLTSQQQASPSMSRTSFLWRSAPDKASSVHVLNDYGFRDVHWKFERDPGRTRILFVGDSFVEGFMATADETIPAGFALEGEKDGLSLESINLGMGATGIANYSLLIRDAVRLFRPDAVFLILYSADLPPHEFNPRWWRNPIRPDRPRWWMPRAADVLRRALRGQEVPRRWRSEPWPFVPSVPDPLNPWSSPQKAGRYARFVEPFIAEAMQRAEFNPFVINALAKAEESLREPIDVTPHFRALRDYAEEHGVKPFVAYLPYAPLVSDYYIPFKQAFNARKEIRSLRAPRYRVHARTLKRTCAILGIPFLDLTPDLEREESLGRHLYWDYDDHMRGSGYLFVARRLYAWWRRAP